MYVFLRAISLVYDLKYQYSCLFFFPWVFSPLFFFCFFFTLLLAAEINISLLFLLQSSSSCVDGSTQSSMQACLLLPIPFFLDTLSMSSLGCKALRRVNNFLVIYYICLSSSFVRFRNGPEFLARRTAQIFIPQMSLILRSFLVLLKNAFLIFSFMSACLAVFISNLSKYL